MDALTPENELICEKLLGWVRAPSCGEQEWLVVEDIDDVPLQRTTPSFATWAEAGLILDRFEELAPVERVDSISYSSCAEQQMVDLSKLLRVGKLRPADIRTAALVWVKLVKS